MVFYVVKYVTWLLKFTYWLILNYANAPGPSGDRGEMATASLVHQMLSFLLCTFSRSLELPATTEGGLSRGSLSPGHKAGTWTAV